MTTSPIFLSVVMVVRNQSSKLRQILSEATVTISTLVSDYELILIDNASDDESIPTLKKLCEKRELPNLQVYALTKHVDQDTASWVGLENALGDFFVVIDPLVDDIEFLSKMIDQVTSGVDVVFANNVQKAPQSFGYKVGSVVFNSLYKLLNGVDLTRDAPQYRILSKRVVNFIIQHPQPAVILRYLPATGGFSKVNLTYNSAPKNPRRKRLVDSYNRGIRLIVSTTLFPMRLVTYFSVFGAVGNILYSIFVIFTAFFKTDIAAGWVTLSLQQSGMFFLISIVLLVLGEYILHISTITNEGPRYYIAQEFNSAVMTRHKKLNLEVTKAQHPIYNDDKSPKPAKRHT